MSENQPSESERQQQLAEIQARLQRLTAERKAELEAEGSSSPPSSAPLPEPEDSMRADEGSSQEVAAPPPAEPVLETPSWLKHVTEPEGETPAPEAMAAPPAVPAPAPPEPEPSPTTPPNVDSVQEAGVPEKPTDPAAAPEERQTLAPTQVSQPPQALEPTPITEPAPVPEAPETSPSDAAAEAQPVSEPRPAKASPLLAAVSATAASAREIARRVGVMVRGAGGSAGGAFRSLRERTGKLSSDLQAKRQQAHRQVQRPQTSEPAAAAAESDADAEGQDERRSRKVIPLRAAVVVGAIVLGGFAIVQLGDLDLRRISESVLPAAEPVAGGSMPSDASSAIVPGARGADSQTAVTVSSEPVAPDANEPVDTVSDDVWTVPPPPEIVSPADLEIDAPLKVAPDLEAPALAQSTPVSGQTTLPGAGTPGDRPTFIPYDVAPKLQNPREIQRLLEGTYPAQLRSAGIEGTVILWIFVDQQGQVQKMEVKESSGYEAMDEAALSTAEKMRFTPAMNRDKATPVWLAQPITFR